MPSTFSSLSPLSTTSASRSPRSARIFRFLIHGSSFTPFNRVKFSVFYTSQELVDIMDRLNVPPERRPNICPKIEKPQALDNIDGIMELSGSLMVSVLVRC